LNPNLSIKYPHKNLEEPLITPNNVPRIYKEFCDTLFLLPKSLLQFEIKKSRTIFNNIYIK